MLVFLDLFIVDNFSIIIKESKAIIAYLIDFTDRCIVHYALYIILLAFKHSTDGQVPSKLILSEEDDFQID